ncbi:unnamed protein product, partial [Mesorhabditis belari]|uniref:TIL domain-containing protein n=1 Tax=Mesorhabditis belari TaxID=2138241 RepID=A0AAF3EPR1_9BILA
MRSVVFSALFVVGFAQFPQQIADPHDVGEVLVNPGQIDLGSPPQACNVNEQWVGLCASSCEATCDNQKPMFCTVNCQNGCQCLPGLVRKADGTCDTAENCPPMATPSITCAINEQWMNCGSQCEPSCDNPVPQVCTTGCFQGCQCQQGFFRQPDGTCDILQQCPGMMDGGDMGGDMGGDD